MSDILFPASAAVIFGVLLAFVLVVPFAAVQYRRRGGLTIGTVMLNFAVLIYLLALIAYTLLPLPEKVSNFCEIHTARPQLVPGQFVSDIIREATAQGGGLAASLQTPALVQIVYNIALFVPLGMIVRHFAKKPVFVAALTGLGVSLLIEVTQITGNWFLYPCAYRLFDVDDLLANTAGALLGALLAPALRILPGQQSMPPGEPRPITAPRRLLGMLCDWIIVGIGGHIVLIIYLAVILDRTDIHAPLDAFFRFVAGGLALAAVQLVWILRTGRTVGEFIVRLEPRPPTTLHARLLRWLLGIGGYTILTTVQLPEVASVLTLFVLIWIGSIFTTRDRRGLSYVLNRWEIQDDRAHEKLHTSLECTTSENADKKG